MYCRNYVFGTGRASDSRDVTVSAADLYDPARGYGFVTERNRREQELLRIPELNSGFEPLYWYADGDLTRLQEDGRGCFLDSDDEVRRLEEEAGERFAGEHRRIPLCFKAEVPHQGNYRVTVAICAEEPLRNALIFTGRRRLGFMGDIPACVPGDAAARSPKTGHGDSPFTRTFAVNVCDIVPRGRTQSSEDKTIDIAIVADRPRISGIRIEEVSCPAIYLTGDSTVTDQIAEYPYAPGDCYSGWGQMLSAYLNGEAAVSNHAHSGLTTDSFRNEGHYTIVRRFIRPGDFYFMQFGHNDQKLEELKARGRYRQNLLRYIKECRDAGAYPVIVTSLARNTWKGNGDAYNDLLAEYAESCLETGEQENVPVLDLHGLSVEFIKKKGMEAAKAYFHPGDYSHSNDYGAYLFAGMAADEIVRRCGSRSNPEYRFLGQCVTGGFGSWEPPKEIAAPVKPKIFEKLKDPGETVKLTDEVENL